MPKKITVFGITYKNLREVSDTYGINYSTLWDAAKREGIDIAVNILKTKDPNVIIEGNVTTEPEIDNTVNKSEYVSDEVIEKVNETVDRKTTPLSGNFDFLLETIKRYSPKSINLIDFENVVNSDILNNYIDDSNNFNIFFYNACIYSNNFYKLTKDSKSINFQILTYKSADQLIDKLLLFYLGKLSMVYSKSKLNIVTKDSGFYTFLEYIDNKNISIDGLEIENDKELKFVRTLATYLSKNKYIKSGRYYTRSDLFTILEKWYLQKKETFTDDDLDHLIEILNKYKCISIINKKYGEQYLFIMQEIYKLSFNSEESNI